MVEYTTELSSRVRRKLGYLSAWFLSHLLRGGAPGAVKSQHFWTSDKANSQSLEKAQDWELLIWLPVQVSTTAAGEQRGHEQNLPLRNCTFNLPLKFPLTITADARSSVFSLSQVHHECYHFLWNSPAVNTAPPPIHSRPSSSPGRPKMSKPHKWIQVRLFPSNPMRLPCKIDFPIVHKLQPIAYLNSQQWTQPWSNWSSHHTVLK